MLSNKKPPCFQSGHVFIGFAPKQNRPVSGAAKLWKILGKDVEKHEHLTLFDTIIIA